MKYTITETILMKISDELIAERREILHEKGIAYSTVADRLQNFDEAARQLGLMPEQVWAVYAHKHWTSIVTYCANPDAPLAEGIRSRMADLANYLDLLAAMHERRKYVSGESSSTTAR